MPRVDQERQKAVRQMIVLRIKLIELVHLMLLSMHLYKTKEVPENHLGHDADRFIETLLGNIVTTLLTITDPRQKTDAERILRKLYPQRAAHITKVWGDDISPGISAMKMYRDKAGAHADLLREFLNGKQAVLLHSDLILNSLSALLRLVQDLLQSETDANAAISSDIESALLDVELAMDEGHFNRRWLRKMHLIESGSYTKSWS